jgi:hypothetical protein
MPKIILINGKKRSGKDFVASLLQEQLKFHNKTSDIISFADPIKEIISTTFNINIGELNEFKNSEMPIVVDNSEITNFRSVLQKFGTEAMKKWFGSGVWVKLLKEKTNKSKANFIIVPDFRFNCETISNITIKVKNDMVESAQVDSHDSENELNRFKFKYIINNTGYRNIIKDVHKIVMLIK